MRERPILFSAPMVQALLAGRKTQTRRTVKPQPERRENNSLPNHYGTFTGNGWNLEEPSAKVLYAAYHCPYGKPGDRLWVKETCYIWGRWNKNGLTKAGRQKWRFKVEAKSVTFDPSHPQIARKTTPKERCMYWRRNSIFMPRWASRITLEITEVRVQRLQEISEEDAMAEGADPIAEEVSSHPTIRYRAAFHSLWSRINGLGSWQTNPWVWAVSFKVTV